jgi:hypothetical protein
VTHASTAHRMAPRRRSAWRHADSGECNRLHGTSAQQSSLSTAPWCLGFSARWHSWLPSLW